MGCIIFFHSLALQTANIVSISGFLSEVSVNNILPIWIMPRVSDMATPEDSPQAIIRAVKTHK